MPSSKGTYEVYIDVVHHRKHNEDETGQREATALKLVDTGDPLGMVVGCLHGFADDLRAKAMETRADALVEYGNSLPDGVTTEAFAEAENLRRYAQRLRDEGSGFDRAEIGQLIDAVAQTVDSVHRENAALLKRLQWMYGQARRDG